MGIVNVFEKPGSGSVDDRGNRTYRRKWLVEMSSLADRPPDTWGTGFPLIPRYSAYPADAGAVALDLECDSVDPPFYEVTIRYSSKPFDFGNQSGDPTQTDASTAPASRPWVIKFGSVHLERVLGPKDLAGVPVVNAANEPFDPPVMIPTSHQTITITAYKDITTFDPISKSLLYQDAVNDADLLLLVTPITTAVYPANSLRCTEYACTSYTEGLVNAWQVDLTLEFNPRGWNPVEVLNAGCNFVKAAGKPPQPIMDETGAKQISKPIPLAANGAVLTAGGALNYKQFTGYYARNFAALLA